jgi:ribonuclease P protein component
MLPIKRRIKKQSFQEIMKEGVFLHSPSFYIRFLNKTPAEPSNFGFVVPNKVIKTSVGRHLAKRKLTAVVEGLLQSIKPGFQAIVFLKKDIRSLTFLETKTEMVDLFKKGKMLNESKT